METPSPPPTPIVKKPTIDITELIRVSKLRAKATKEGKLPTYYLDLERNEAIALANEKASYAQTSTNSDEILTLKLPSVSTTNQPNAPQLNLEQQKAVDYALSGQSFVLIGPAGTGKTFTVNAIATALIEKHKLALMTENTKVLRKGEYGFLGCAYTRRATSVVRAGLPDELTASTIHAAIEFAPVKVLVTDEATGMSRESMRFEPQRNKRRPLPQSLSFIAMDESSMCSTDLEAQLVEALPHSPQRLYIGDICQLKPVFGDSVLGYKLIELPVVELTQVYRQKEGEILDFATNIRLGNQIANFTTPEFKNPRLTVKQFKTPEREGIRIRQFGTLLQTAVATGDIDPLAGDLILCPYNVSVGTIELNKWVADYYDQANKRQIVPVLAGRELKYLAIGDKILVDREDAIITNIKPNPKYIGRFPPRPSHKVNRWGSQRATEYSPDHQNSSDNDEDSDSDDIESLLGGLGGEHQLSIDDIESAEDRKMEASHVIEYMFLNPSLQQKHYYANNPDRGNTEFISSAGDVNKVELAYVITVHKSQGSQAKHVMLLLSNQHKTMLYRELLYTAVTRAQSRLTIYCDAGNLTKCINNPRIKGDTLEEKSEYFHNKLAERQEG